MSFVINPARSALSGVSRSRLTDVEWLDEIVNSRVAIATGGIALRVVSGAAMSHRAGPKYFGNCSL
jgi:hypothetical protein